VCSVRVTNVLQAALAAIIVVALKGLYLQVKDAKQSWMISKSDMVSIRILLNTITTCYCS